MLYYMYMYIYSTNEERVSVYSLVSFDRVFPYEISVYRDEINRRCVNISQRARLHRKRGRGKGKKNIFIYLCFPSFFSFYIYIHIRIFCFRHLHHTFLPLYFNMGIVQTNPTKYKPELIMCLRHVCLFSNTYSIPRV